MAKKYICAIALLLLLFTFISGEVVFNNVDGVFPLNNRNYAPNVIKLFDSAKSTIHIMLLEGGYYPERPDGVNMKLYNSLFNAVNRGIEVIVILDQSGFNPSQSLRNIKLGDYLKSGGVNVLYDDPDVTTHAKTLIIDSLYSVVGSTNWSYQALDKNNECSVMIKSKDVGTAYEEYFEKLKAESSVKMTVMETEDEE